MPVTSRASALTVTVQCAMRTTRLCLSIAGSYTVSLARTEVGSDRLCGVTIRDAAAILSTYFRPSRLIASSIAPADLFLKLECELPTGSFKVRGAMYALAVNLQRRQIREVVASSTGNHGAAVAYAANRHGAAA